MDMDKAKKIKLAVSVTALVASAGVLAMYFSGPEAGEDVGGSGGGGAAKPAQVGQEAAGKPAAGKKEYTRPEYAREGGGVLAPSGK